MRYWSGADPPPLMKYRPRQKRRKILGRNGIVMGQAILTNFDIEALPVEILRMIFVFSGNVNLPQTSMILAKKLRRSINLERQMVESHTVDGALDIQSIPPSVLTCDIFKDCGVTSFVGEFVPRSLEFAPYQKDTVDVVMRLVASGLSLESPAEFYVQLLKHGRIEDTRVLFSKNFPCDYRAPILTLQHGQSDLAMQLLRSLGRLKEEIPEIWQQAQASNSKEILEYLSALVLDTGV